MPPVHGPAAAFRWLADALELLRRQPRAVLVAGLVVVLIALAPSLLQMQLQRLLPGGGVALQALLSLVGLLVMPPVLGGFFRLLRAVDRGQPAPSALLWSVFHDARSAWRLIACNFAYALFTVAMLVALAYALGGPALFEYLRALSSLKPEATPADLPALPPGALRLVALMLVVALFVTTAQQLAAARIALSGAPLGPAIGFGAVATLRQALALALFYLPMLLLGTLATALLGIVAAVVFAALSLVSKALGIFVLGVLLLLALAVLYALMLAFFYCAWRALSGDVPAAGSSTPPDLPPHEIAA